MTRLVSLLCLLAVAACSSSTSPSCDSSPGTLGGVCSIPNAGQCVDFAGLGTSDQQSAEAGCQGTWVSTPCTADGRIATCRIPPLGPNTNVHCSANAVIELRYYSSRYTLEQAQTLCNGVPGAVFTPG